MLSTIACNMCEKERRREKKKERRRGEEERERMKGDLRFDKLLLHFFGS